MEFEINSEPFEELVVRGKSKGAELVVTVEDGEILDIECLCAACQEAFNIGILEALGGVPLPDGIVYLRHWFETHPGIPGRSAEEYSAGLIINEVDDG